MNISPKVASEIAFHEGLVREAYRDSEGVLTWSFGITSASGHKVERYLNNPATIERCVEVYVWLLDKKYAPAVRKMFKGHNLTDAQFAAALSFHWNTGAIERATWVRKWLSGDVAGARSSFMAWSKPASIIGRRRAERDLFFDGDWSSDGKTTLYQNVSASGSPIDPTRVDIVDDFTAALERHYASDEAIPVPVPAPRPETPVDVHTMDIRELAAAILEGNERLAETMQVLVDRLDRMDGNSLPPINQITTTAQKENPMGKLAFFFMRLISKEQAAGIFRHMLTLVGGFLIAKGVADEALVNELTGSAMVAFGAFWSFYTGEKNGVEWSKLNGFLRHLLTVGAGFLYAQNPALGTIATEAIPAILAAIGFMKSFTAQEKVEVKA